MLTGGRVVEAGQRLSEMPATVRATPKWAYFKGRLLLLEGESEKAVVQLSKANRRVSGSPIIQNDLAVALVRVGNAGQATSLLEDLSVEYPDDRDIRLNLAVARMASGQAENAQESLSRLARMYPQWFDARFNLALAALFSGDTQTAVFEFRQAQRLRPGCLDVLIGLAAACTRFMDPVCSEQAIREAISRYPEDPVALLGWGNHLEDNGDVRGAFDQYRRATRVDPGCADCWYSLGKTAERLDDTKTAIHAYRRHIETVPKSVSVKSVRMRLRELVDR